MIASARVVGMPRPCIASPAEVLADRRAQHRAAIAHPRKAGQAGALDLDIPALVPCVDDLAEQDGAAVAQLGDPDAELVPGVDCGDGADARESERRR